MPDGARHSVALSWEPRVLSSETFWIMSRGFREPWFEAAYGMTYAVNAA